MLTRETKWLGKGSSDSICFCKGKPEVSIGSKGTDHQCPMSNIAEVESSIKHFSRKKSSGWYNDGGISALKYNLWVLQKRRKHFCKHRLWTTISYKLSLDGILSSHFKSQSSSPPSFGSDRKCETESVPMRFQFTIIPKILGLSLHNMYYWWLLVVTTGSHLKNGRKLICINWLLLHIAMHILKW